MPIVFMLTSVGAALMAAIVTWVKAGFLWAVLAYVGVGSVTVLLLGAAYAIVGQREQRHGSAMHKPEAVG